MSSGGKRVGSGRKPIPASLKKTLGAKRSKEELNEWEDNEPKIAENNLKCPSFLTDLAKKEWKRIIKLVKGTEVLNNLDLYLLASYCEAVSIFNTAQTEWKRNSQVLGLDERGKYTVNPYIKIMQAQTLIIQKLSEQLCLSPVGRARMGMNKKGEKSAIDKFLEDDF